jgi:hypothetical protein
MLALRGKKRVFHRSMYHKTLSVILVFVICFQLSFITDATIFFPSPSKNNDGCLDLTLSFPCEEGEFNGWWESNDQSISGDLQGLISFGRTDSTGWISGVITPIDSSESFSLKARIIHQLMVGVITSSSKSMIFMGNIDVLFPSFSFSVFVPTLGRIHGEGSYDGSFLPKPTGPYSVGKRSYHLIDESRDEWFTDDESDVRELMMNIWYPSNEKSIEKRINYMDKITFSWLRDQGPVPLISIPPDAYTFVHPYVYENILPERSKEFPVLLFSPGYDGVDVIYTSFIDELVSYGYIVVSMNHPYVSGVTVFPDDRAVYIAELPGNFSESRDFLKQSQRTVIDDALFALDTVELLNDSDPLLAGCFDLSRVGMFGHSFGGAATMSCCYEDERVQAGFTLDGVVYDEFLTGSIDTPFLLMCAEARFNHSSYTHVWNQFSTDAYQVGILGSSHYGFTDVGMLLSHMMPLIPGQLLGFGTVDAKYLVSVTRLFEHAFFDVYLKGAEKEILISLFDDFDDVMTRSK